MSAIEIFQQLSEFQCAKLTSLLLRNAVLDYKKVDRIGRHSEVKQRGPSPMKFDKEVCKQAESRLNQVLFEAEVRRLIRQEVEKFMAASLTIPQVKEGPSTGYGIVAQSSNRFSRQS
jgi:hypothetical protein